VVSSLVLIFAVIVCSTIISSVHSFASLTVIHIKGPNNNSAKEKKKTCSHYFMWMELFVLIFNAVIPYSQKEDKFTECVICKLRISQNIGSLTPGIKKRGWQLGSEEETKFTCNSKGVFLTLSMVMLPLILESILQVQKNIPV